MIYIKCPTCRRLLGDIQIPYEKILNQICRDEELKIISTHEADILKQKLVNSFDITDRYCCKPRLMTYKKLSDIVK
jgi:DNA-directed RNA polymerase subunit N (RpoN/RPB10)